MASNKAQIPAPQQFEKSSSADQVMDDPNDIGEQQKYVLSRYWDYKQQQIAAATKDELKKHEFPLSRIKRIMTADEDVRMVSSEAPILFAKACEFFIQELTIKSWLIAEHFGRLTIRKNDIVEVITNETNYYDFLFDVVGGGSSSFHADPAGPVASLSMMNQGEQKDDEMTVDDQTNEGKHQENDQMNGGEEVNEVNEMIVDGAAN